MAEASLFRREVLEEYDATGSKHVLGRLKPLIEEQASARQRACLAFCCLLRPYGAM